MLETISCKRVGLRHLVGNELDLAGDNQADYRRDSPIVKHCEAYAQCFQSVLSLTRYGPGDGGFHLFLPELPEPQRGILDKVQDVDWKTPLGMA